MTKKDLINNIRNREGLTRNQATRIVNALFDDISSEVAKCGDMYIPKFGRLYVSSIMERQCKHPETKKDITIPAHKIVRFRMAKEFRRKLEK